MGETHGKQNNKYTPPHPIFGFAENGMGWELHVNLNPWVSPMAIIVMPFQGIFEVSKYFNFGGMRATATTH